ncbi:MAG: hypothetical protein GY898_30995 [Proteobacteria bacterium]|nr:hypothetical protein [Pseudomonadota bacterium]
MRTAALLFSLACVLAPGLASAQCPNFFFEETADGRVTPSSSDSLAPVNTWVWYTVVEPDTTIGGTTSGLSLLSLGSGEEVGLEALGTVRSDDRLLLAYQPEAELEPDTDYEIEFDREPGALTDISRVAFRTSDERDTTAPMVPEAIGQDVFTDYNQLGSEPCMVTDYNDEVRFFLAGDGDFRFMAHEVEVDAIDDLFADVVSISETSDVGYVDDIGPNQDLSFRFSAVDLAGNFSGWSDPLAVTTPAPGCVDDGTQVTRASLLLAAVLLLLRRKRRLKAGHPAVFGLLLALLLPTAALADSPPLITGEPEVEEEAPPEPVAKPDWKIGFSKELTLHTRGWGIAAAGTGVLQASFLLMQPARVPWALQLSIANTILWLPAVSTWVVMAGTGLLLRSTGDSAQSLSKGLRRAGSVFGIVSLALFQASIPLAIYGGTYDPSIGVSVLGVQLSLVFVAIATTVLSRRVDHHGREAYKSYKKGLEVSVFPTPNGIVVRF